MGPIPAIRGLSNVTKPRQHTPASASRPVSDHEAPPGFSLAYADLRSERLARTRACAIPCSVLLGLQGSQHLRKDLGAAGEHVAGIHPLLLAIQVGD